MEKLVQKLQQEAGLNKEQALKVLSVVKDYMDKEDPDTDWGKFFKSKYEDVLGTAKQVYGEVSEKAQPYADKIGETVEGFLSKAKKEVQDLTQKATEYFDDDKKKS